MRRIKKNENLESNEQRLTLREVIIVADGLLQYYENRWYVGAFWMSRIEQVLQNTLHYSDGRKKNWEPNEFGIVDNTNSLTLRGVKRIKLEQKLRSRDASSIPYGVIPESYIT